MNDIIIENGQFILLPLPRKYSSGYCPHTDELLLNYLAAVMLYSAEEDKVNRYKYMVLACHVVFATLLSKGIFPSDMLFLWFVNKLRFIYSVFHENQPDMYEPPRQDEYCQAQVLDTYQQLISESHLAAQGGSSIHERFAQGQLAGALLTVALVEKISLDKSAELLEHQLNKLHKSIPQGELPTMTAKILTHTIWPKFKNVAHFWAATLDFKDDMLKKRHGFYFLSLEHIREKERISCQRQEGYTERIHPAFWPSSVAGWRSFVYKARHVFNLCKKSRMRNKIIHKPLLSSKECWKVIFKQM